MATDYPRKHRFKPSVDLFFASKLFYWLFGFIDSIWKKYVPEKAKFSKRQVELPYIKRNCMFNFT